MSLLDYPPMNEENWLQIGSEKKAGVLILCRLPDALVQAAICWFKYRSSKNAGPIPANEYIASRLGQLLDLPVAKVQFKKFGDRDGSMSFIVAPEPNPWVQFPYKKSLAAYLENYSVLADVVVFDIFINNFDRDADNLLYSRVSTRTHKYNLHLIDHGHALHGSSIQPSESDFDFKNLIVIDELKDLFRNGLDFFREALVKVTSITEEQIDAILSEVPDYYLSTTNKQHLRKKLLLRKKRIYEEFSIQCKQGSMAQ